MSSAIFIAVATAVCTLIWLMWPSKALRMAKKIPGPPMLPLIGNAHMIKLGGSEFYDQILQFCNDFKNETLFRLALGPQMLFAIYQAEAVELILSSSTHITKSHEYIFLHPWLGTGLLTSTGAKWRVRRKLLTPTFHFRILQDFLQVFNEQTKVMVQKLHEKRAGKGPFDIFPHITLCALDIICDTAMGKTVNAQENVDSEYVTAVYKMSELVHRRQKSPWLWNDTIYHCLTAGKEHEKCLNILHSFTNKVIKEKGEKFDKEVGSGSMSSMDIDNMGSKRRVAFLDMLLYGRQEANFSDEDIREEVDTFMFEGHDTTAAAGNWAVHLIGANPVVQNKLHEEIDAVFGDDDRPCTMDDIKSMKYLECVIKETLRLFPSVPMFAREIAEDVEIGGYNIPKGGTAVIVTSALHRDDRFFPDPEKFDPERFSLENSAGRHPYAYVPFSAGLRNCIGQKFAMNELKVMLSSLLRNFTVTAHQTREELRPSGEVILRPENGIIVSLAARNK